MASPRTFLRRSVGAVRKFVGTILKSTFRVASIKSALSGESPGSWQNDHREESLHFTGWNYVAIHALCMQAMRAKVTVVRDLTKRSQPAGFSKSDYRAQHAEEEALPADHPLVKILKHPSPSQNGSLFRYRRMLQLRLTGTQLIWDVRTATGMVVERYVIPTALAEPIRPNPEYQKGAYRLTPQIIPAGWDEGWMDITGYESTMGMIIPAEQVTQLRFPHPLFTGDGYSPLSAGARWVDTAEMVDHARWAHLRQGPDPSLIVEAPDDTDPSEAELDAASAKFNAKYAGPQNTGKAMFVTGGTKATAISTSPKEMSYELAFDQLEKALMAIHATPPSAIGVTESTSYSALFAALKQYVILTVQPYLDLLAESDTHTLAAQYGDDILIRYEAVMVDDPQLLEEQLRTDIEAGAMTIKEFRSIRGLPPFGDDRDDQLVTKQQSQSANGSAGVPGGSGLRESEKGPGVATGIPQEKTLTNGNGHETDEQLISRLFSKTIERMRTEPAANGHVKQPWEFL